MRQKPLDPKIMPALLAAAEQAIESNPTSQSKGVKQEQEGNDVGQEPVDFTTAAMLAAGWCRCLAAIPRFGSTLEYGMSGLACAVILSATPR